MQKNSTDEIVSLFFSASRALKRKLDSASPIFQLPTAQVEILRLIAEKKQILMKEAADFLSITPPSATVLVNKLVSLDLVERSSDKNDRRTVCLTLTEKGSKAMDKAILERCRTFKKLLSKLSGKQQSQFLNILKRMSN